jgi:hypothetical protein
VDDLQKENFDLKLRLYYMEEALEKNNPDGVKLEIPVSFNSFIEKRCRLFLPIVN